MAVSILRFKAARTRCVCQCGRKRGTEPRLSEPAFFVFGPPVSSLLRFSAWSRERGRRQVTAGFRQRKHDGSGYLRTREYLKAKHDEAVDGWRCPSIQASSRRFFKEGMRLGEHANAHLVAWQHDSLGTRRSSRAVDPRRVAQQSPSR